jgi:hypothetical protein
MGCLQRSRLCDGLLIATVSLEQKPKNDLKLNFNRQSLKLIMSDETKVQKSTNADGNSVSQPIAKQFML